MMRNVYISSTAVTFADAATSAIMQVNSTVYLRLNLHSNSRPSVRRGTAGIVLQTHPSLVVNFGPPGRSIHVTCNVEWLELSPGTVSCALAENCASKLMFYNLGMIVTDLVYPQDRDLHHQRWYTTALSAASEYKGFEVWQGKHVMDACAIRSGLMPRGVEPSALGLILCEQPRAPGELEMILLRQIVDAFLEQWEGSTVVCVLICRDYCAVNMMRYVASLPASGSARLRVTNASTRMHYEPIRNNPNYASERGMAVGDGDTIWNAIIVQPSTGVPIDVATPVYVPDLVWRTAALRQLRTLQLAAYTMESTKAIGTHWNEQLRLHGFV